MTLFLEIVLALILASLCGAIAYLLKQPTIVGFIVAGLIIGSLGYLATDNIEIIRSLASIGVALLLFTVGLEMNFTEIKHIGRPAMLIGVGQIAATFAIGFLICSLLGFNYLSSFYVSIALSFSSTIIVVKLLSGKKDLRSLYGRIVLGVLLVQDVVAILILIFLSGLGDGNQIGSKLFLTFVKGGGFIFLIFLVSRFLPKLLDFIGKSQELLYLFSIAWALGVAALASSPIVGLSIEIGGFLAGLALAGSSENFQIAARLRPIRDFFIILFFVGLGTSLLAGPVSITIKPAIILSLFVLVGNPVVVLIIMGILGYRARVSFLSSLAVAQISEFSFIIVALGYTLGHLEASYVSLVTLVGIATIFTSSYLINYSDRLYKFFRPSLRRLERRERQLIGKNFEAKLNNHVVLVGVHRMGQTISRALSNKGTNFVAVDFDPIVVKQLKEIRMPVFYGDIADEAIQEFVGLDRAKVVISTVPDVRDNLAILSFMRESNLKAKVILTAESEFEGKELYEAGADYVLLPHFLGGRELVEIINESGNLANLSSLKERDLGLMEDGR
ncbi:MAG: cation:proton antiporter [Candidatus Colwellbacteria bacterium]|nr:cation:proton antiporter [Candidatus Colwellbacteria bacterium]